MLSTQLIQHWTKNASSTVWVTPRIDLTAQPSAWLIRRTRMHSTAQDSPPPNWKNKHCSRLKKQVSLTDQALESTALPVCLSAGQLYKNGWTNWGAICSVDSDGTEGPRVRWGTGSPQGKGQQLWGWYPRWTNQKILWAQMWPNATIAV